MKSQLITILIAASILFACNSGNGFEVDDTSGYYDGMDVVSELSSNDKKENAPVEQTVANGDMEKSNSETIEDEGQSNNKTFERKLIKTGDISYETSDVNAAHQFITNLVKTKGGYISGEYAYDYDYQLSRNLSLRIPSENFDAFVEELSQEVGSFESKNIEVKDVTEEFIDIQSRLKTKYELEASYKELLKKAKNVGDVLDIERELNYVRGDIESMEGRLRFLKDQVGYSTLDIYIYQVQDAKVLNFFGQVGERFQDGWRGFKYFVLGLVGAWPFILMLIGIAFLGRRWWKKRKASKSTF